MSSLIRSSQNNSQVLRDISAPAGFAPDFYTRLMRSEAPRNLLDQALALRVLSGLMNVARLMPQGLRYTLRYAAPRGNSHASD